MQYYNDSQKIKSHSFFQFIVHIHHYYPDVPVIDVPFTTHETSCLVMVTSCRPEILKRYSTMYAKKQCTCVLFVVENKGGDIYPFLLILDFLKNHAVECGSLLKLHSKQNNGLRESWLSFLLDSDRASFLFSHDDTLGMVGHSILHMSSFDACNFGQTLSLLKSLKADVSQLQKALDVNLCSQHYRDTFDPVYFQKRFQQSKQFFFRHEKRRFLGWNPSCPQFIFGTMFWIRGKLVKTLSERVQASHLQTLQKQVFRSRNNCMLAHAWERVFGIWTQSQGFHLYDKHDWEHHYDAFDAEFYMSMYPDVRHYGKQKVETHWIRHGKKEKRVCNAHQLAYYQFRLDKNSTCQLPIDMNYSTATINILIRTGNRPSLFQMCITSVLSQNYTHKKIHVSYDTDESLLYLNTYTGLTYVAVTKTDVPFFYNLFCNDLLQQVQDGWVVFLDDDEMFSNPHALSILVSHIEKNNQDTSFVYIWKFARADKLIFPSNIQNVRLGEMDTCSFCFHSNFWRTRGCVQWKAQQAGDYHFFHQLVHGHDKCVFIDSILTQTIQKDRIGNFGQSE